MKWKMILSSALGVAAALFVYNATPLRNFRLL